MKLKKLLLSVFFTGCCVAAFSQDIHFSQYYASPLTLNPALTGGFNGVFRLAANYRNQWFSVLGKSSYSTYSGSFDMPLLKKRLKFDRLGVGLVIFNDKSGDGGLTNLTVHGAVAYHKTLDAFNRFKLALGVTAGMVQKRVDFSKLTFETQFDGFDFDPSLSNGEGTLGLGRYGTQSIIYPDFVVGVLFQGRFLDNVNAYVGGSVAHAHKPKESFLGQNNRLNPRFSAHLGVDIGLGDYVIVTPGMLYMSQSTAQEITAGLAFGYKINSINTIYLGAWYRVLDKDAMIAMLAYEVAGFRAGFSFDANLSDLKVVSNSIGAVEVSLIYIHKKQEDQKVSPMNFCPRF